MPRPPLHVPAARKLDRPRSGGAGTSSRRQLKRAVRAQSCQSSQNIWEQAKMKGGTPCIGIMKCEERVSNYIAK